MTDLVARLDALGVPVDASRREALETLRLNGGGVATTAIRVALAERRRRAGLTPRAHAVRKPGGDLRVPERHAAQVRRARAALEGIYDERLRGAACVGRHELFDAELDYELAEARSKRHRAAQAICARCPVIASCHQIAHVHADSISGVWAGEVR
ncbi:WhiB family transcriptional regulator [Prescottella equi]|uniref:WhiB family transcriptional regulator n=1 Tax=Prescottella TaxID=2979332 RepID=UPI002576BAE8|nr:WhiB family transcriptional regulator [Prescottella equi]WJJ11505.1 WhiB family transcriptional regulator [Prescottella equi]